jgi:hypothetical protein
MPRYKVLNQKDTRSVVFESADLERLNRYAQSRRRSLSSVIREAVRVYLAQVVDKAAPTSTDDFEAI